MKKLLVVLIIALGILAYNYGTVASQDAPKQLKAAQKQLTQYQAKEAQKTKEEQELERLQNPQLIKGQLVKQGKIIVLEGSERYKDFLDEKTYFNITKRQLYIDFLYKWNYWIDLKDIKVVSIKGKTATLLFYQDSLKANVALDEKQSKMWSGKTLIFTKGYTPEDTTTIRKQIFDKVSKEVVTGDNYNEAYQNLKDVLTNLVEKLGYTDIQFKYSQHNSTVSNG